jgi:signal peptidase II
VKALFRNLVLPVVFPVLLLDQLVKFWIKTSFTIGEQYPMVPGLLELQFIENEGMAFGWALPGVAGKLALTLFRVIAAIGIGWFALKLIRESAHRGLILSVGFVWAGAMGNIIDSAVYGLVFSASGWEMVARFLPVEGGYAPLGMGHVVDMFHFTLRWPASWPIASMQGREVFPPIWNVADAAISCGMIWILIRQRTYFPPEPGEVKASEPSSEQGAEEESGAA